MITIESSVTLAGEWLLLFRMFEAGAEGGDGGGKVLAEGSPEKIGKSKKPYTGQYLKKYL